MSNDFDKKIMGYYAEIANTHGNIYGLYITIWVFCLIGNSNDDSIRKMIFRNNYIWTQKNSMRLKSQ